MEHQQAATDLINWATKKQNQYKTASAKYYNKNYMIRDDMTPEEKQKVSDNIKKRQEYYKRRYEANKDIYKQRVIAQRAAKKMMAQQASNQPSQTANPIPNNN